ncbi:unnamed protein product [Effrenium voratum]|uniref:malate dehydrogenase n=1 Tax=Effrenium voratum TaxID=2562239 RepID=A0AA36I1I9_9DINO|nr:unnamed protein product [Effrenium voratum]
MGASCSAGIRKAIMGGGSHKVCVCGGAGGIGQPLCLLMAMDPNVRELSIVDLNVAMVPPDGVAKDLGHIESKVKVTGYVMEVGTAPKDSLEDCLSGCSLVLVPAGMPRKPGMTRDDLFKVNCDIAKGMVEACAKFCPQAVVALIVNPVNSIVPAMAELYSKAGLDPWKIVGVTSLDSVRANKFVADLTGCHPSNIEVPVIGGHAGVTILPVFSQDPTSACLAPSKIEELDKRTQDAGTEVVHAKNGKGSATLSMAYAGARLGRAVLAGMSGRPTVECAYVKSDVTDLPYFASQVLFGKGGVSRVLPIGQLNDYEKRRLNEATVQLKTEINTGLRYAKDAKFAN